MTALLKIVVVGAGLTGLTTALLLAREGHQVTLLDRDPEPPPPTAGTAWAGWSRPGVNQFRQPHLMLPRWRQEIARELPELLTGLCDVDAARVNMLHLQPDAATHGWQPGDEQFDTVTARRPVLEAVLGRLAETEPGLRICRGAQVTGLTVGYGSRTPRIRGVRTSAGQLAADLVVDAAGRRTGLPAMVAQLSGVRPQEDRDACGFGYYSRYFAARGQLPSGLGPVLTHQESLSVLTVPGDAHTFCIVLVASAQDRELRALRHPHAWLAAAQASPTAGPWIAQGDAISEVLPLAGLEDVRRSYLLDGVPMVTGIVAVGDSAAATNPSLGRGATLGLLHACALRDTLVTCSDTPRGLVAAFGAATASSVDPWVEATLRFDRHRLGELGADLAGTPYLTTDPTWAFTTALLAGAANDPVLARASSRIAGMLAAPAEVFADPAVGSRIGQYVGGARYSSNTPSRSELLTAVATAAPAA